MKTARPESDYTERFIDCQKKIKGLLERPPKGIQNWSIQKTINYKKAVKKCEPLIKLKPASKHRDFLKMEQGLTSLAQYYS